VSGHRQAEERVREGYERAYITRPRAGDGAHWHPARHGVNVTAVELTGAYPEICLVFRFHFRSQPECAFAWHGPLWDPTVSEDLNPDPWSNIEVYFMEDLGTRRAGWVRDCRHGVTMNVGRLRSNGAFIRAEHERPRKTR
jgi:hypothetical protein